MVVDEEKIVFLYNAAFSMRVADRQMAQRLPIWWEVVCACYAAFWMHLVGRQIAQRLPK